MVAQLEYASVIGSLMYAMHCTRPDIAFAVCKLSRFTSNPSVEHWNAIGSVLSYLKRTINLGLFYNNYPAGMLVGYPVQVITNPHQDGFSQLQEEQFLGLQRSKHV